MAQVVATIAYGIRGLRTGETTWSWPDFHSDPTQENLGQIARWSLNQAPDWTYPPLAIANQYKDRHTKEIKRERYRLILVRGYELDWLSSYGKQGKDVHRGIIGYRSKISPSQKLCCMPMLPTARHIQHMFCCRPVCTKPALALLSLDKAPLRRLSRYQACSSSMDGELNPV